MIVVEGFFDCLRMRQAGWASVVALLGTELYEHPAELLQARFGRVLLMLDGDEAGRLGWDRVAARLRNRCEVGVIQLPEGEQPDQLPESELQEGCQNTVFQAAASGRLRSANDPIGG